MKAISLCFRLLTAHMRVIAHLPRQSLYSIGLGHRPVRPKQFVHPIYGS